MEIEQLPEAEHYRHEAQELLTSVSNLLKKAAGSFDSSERRELYLRAMDEAQKAYNLLGEARRLGAELFAPEADKLEN